jgi:hypothetical protein
MILVFGFLTSDTNEVPEILYLGDDGAKAQEIAESAPHPRVAFTVNPTLRPVRHWTPETAEAYEALQKSKAAKKK